MRKINVKKKKHHSWQGWHFSCNVEGIFFPQTILIELQMLTYIWQELKSNKSFVFAEDKNMPVNKLYKC